MRHIGSGTKSFVLERFAESWHICSMFMVYVGILKICLCQKSICFEETSSFSTEQRVGWVCGLGHGVLKTTPEDNVRLFVKKIRESFA